jgi:DNA-binding LacI/PurR family transcriptional regulator
VPHAVREGGFDRDQALAAVRAMFRDGQGPNAIFAGGDMMAMAALDCLRGELGLRVPQDVSVIGYDDVPIASWPVYDLTTVQQPVDAMAEATVQLMLGALRQDRPVMPQKIQVAAPLIWRGSARKPAGML